MKQCILKGAISEVNSTLGFYEKKFTALQRLSIGDPEEIYSLEQYVECRLNKEVYLEIPELEPYVEMFDGHLFVVTDMEDKDEIRNRFSFVTVELNTNPNDYIGDMEFVQALENVRNLIGGSKIKFSASPKRMKIIISK